MYPLKRWRLCNEGRSPLGRKGKSDFQPELISDDGYPRAWEPSGLVLDEDA